jgi:putative redox protein
MTSKVIYKNGLSTICEHIESSAIIHTAAPKDNHGDGSNFSPTDLTATSLAACMLSIMGIYAREHDLNIENSFAEVKKVMHSEPRRIGEIHVHFKMQHENLDEKHFKILERVAHACPVGKSLHPDLKQVVSFEW